MKQSSKAWGFVFFMGMMLLGNWAQAADNNVSTVDSQELFHSQLLQDMDKGKDKTAQVDKAVENAVENLPQLNSRLRWAAVKTPAELEEKQRAQQRQKKAIPIIITAADMDREKKAQKRGEKTDRPSLITPRPLETPKTKPAPEAKPVPQQPAAPPAPQNTMPPHTSPALQLPADIIELPPVMPIGGEARNQVSPVQEIVELPPVERVGSDEQTIMAEALAEAMTVELVVDEFTAVTEELPPVEPVV